MRTLLNELQAIWYILVGAAVLIAGGLISDFFTGIGDKLFGKKSNEPPEAH